MKKGILVIFAIVLAATSKAQTKISIDSLNQHIGDSVTICTKIYGGIFLDKSKGTPTLLNAGGSYPANPLTVLLWADTRAKFSEKPEVFLKGKNVCITGKLILYKEKPEIIVTEFGQIKVQETP